MNEIAKKEIKKREKLQLKPKKRKIRMQEQLFVDPYSLRDKQINENIRRLRKAAKSPELEQNKVEELYGSIEDSLYENKKRFASKDTKPVRLLKADSTVDMPKVDILNPSSQSYFKSLVPRQSDASSASRYAKFLEYKSRFPSSYLPDEVTEEPSEEESRRDKAHLTPITLEQLQRATIL